MSGYVRKGDGTAAALLPVTLAVAPASDGPMIELGTATANSAGAWSFTMPSPLPAALQAQADANDGVLNVEALSMGKVTGSSVIMSAAATIPVGVSSGTAASAAVQDVRARGSQTLALAVAPAATLATAPAPPSDTSGSKASASTVAGTGSTDYTLATGSAPTTVSADNYNPNVVNGVDYSSSPVQAMSTSDCLRPSYGTETIKTAIAYTVVGEAHAYWDATGDFSYDSTAGSQIGAGVSQDFGSHFSASGSVYVGNSTGVSTGYSGGPYKAYQWKVPIHYTYWRETAICGSYKTVIDHIRPDRYQIPSGGAPGQYGASVTSKDGYTRWYSAPYRSYVANNSFVSFTKGHSSGFSLAASVFGFGPTVTTTYNRDSSTDRSQSIHAGAGNGTSSKHDIFSYTRTFSYGDPGTFYSF